MDLNKRHFLATCAMLGLTAPIANACSSGAVPAANTPTSEAPNLPTAAPTATGPVSATLLALRVVRASSSVFQPLELAIDTDGIVANPYDPAEFDLLVTFTDTQGQAQSVPAFFFQDYDPTTLAPVGAGEWRVRFTPTSPGAWQAQAALAAPAIASKPLGFDVALAEYAPGFVRVYSANPAYFAFDNGALYLPIGLNLGWSTSPINAVLADYERWFSALSAQGGNYARVWMASWSFAIEWNDTGLGNYSQRMLQAWLLDQVFLLAEKYNIKLMLCLINHGQFSETTNTEWKNNPYNHANGGPLNTPAAFVSDEQARALFKRRLRYIAARWAASPSLFSWEWWNEINWTPITDKQLKPWIIEMTTELRRFDPYRHLIGTSHANGNSFTLWKMPEIDYIQHHDYSAYDLARNMPKWYVELAKKGPGKPVLMSEIGLSATGEDDSVGGESIHLHNSLWAAPLSGFAGTAMHWWWDTFIDKTDKWPEYKGPAEFFAGEDLAALAPSMATITKIGPVGLTLQNQERALLWLRSGAYDAGEAMYAQAKAAREHPNQTTWVYELPAQQDVSLTISGLHDGTYHVAWYDPHAARWLDTESADTQNGALTIIAPVFTSDLAARITLGGA